MVSCDGRKGWINRLAVDPDYRNQGIARRLVHEAENYLSEQGMEIITCLIEIENTASQNVFTKLGYQPYPVAYFRKLKHDSV